MTTSASLATLSVTLKLSQWKPDQCSEKQSEAYNQQYSATMADMIKGIVLQRNIVAMPNKSEKTHGAFGTIAKTDAWTSERFPHGIVFLPQPCHESPE